ncbi:hypothetical protein [Galbibacter sp. BG1]
MDNATQIKNNLISRIKNSKDLDFLKALQTIFDSTEQSSYQLSSEQENSITIGKKEIKKGDFSNNDTVISEMKEWLAKK